MNIPFSRSAALFSLGLALSLTACNKQLDIEPRQSVDATTAIDTQDKVGSAVVGLYAELDDPNLYGTNLILVPELLAVDNYIRFQGTFSNFRDIAVRNTNSSNSTAETIWREAYQAINQANLVLEALPVVTSESLHAQYEGEARFVRAAMYFELVRLYGKQYVAGTTNSQPGVPINLTPVRTVEQASASNSRATVEAVYAQVIDDLTQATKLLPASNGVRATAYSAHALLARVYLQQGNFAAAKEKANLVITKSGKALAPTVESVFSSRNSSESLFEIQQNDQNNAGSSNAGLGTHYASIGQFGRGDVLVLPAFANLYGATDARGYGPTAANGTPALLYNSTGARRVAAPGRALRTGKFKTASQNIPVIRLAEMYLIRAETAFRAGDVPGALADLNLIRSRSNATLLTEADLTPLNGLTTILRERQLELAFEGFRIYDLKRFNAILVPARAATATTAAVPAVLANSDRLTLPIPKRETDLNDPNSPALEQNPGY
jgi:tetratricopeptide (TPR) repeat protein